MAECYGPYFTSQVGSKGNGCGQEDHTPCVRFAVWVFWDLVSVARQGAALARPGRGRYNGIAEGSEEQVPNGPLRSASGDLLSLEPPAFDSWEGTGKWVKSNIFSIRAALDIKVDKATKVARESPAAILQEVEKVTLSTSIYVAEITLDTNAYREAARMGL